MSKETKSTLVVAIGSLVLLTIVFVVLMNRSKPVNTAPAGSSVSNPITPKPHSHDDGKEHSH